MGGRSPVSKRSPCPCCPLPGRSLLTLISFPALGMNLSFLLAHSPRSSQAPTAVTAVPHQWALHRAPPTRLLPLPLQVRITVPSSAPCLPVSLRPAHHAFTEQDSPLPGGDQSYLLTSEHPFFSQLTMSLLHPIIHGLISAPVKNLSYSQQTHEKMLCIAHH